MSKRGSVLKEIDDNLVLLREKYSQLENSSDLVAFDLCRRQLAVMEEIAAYVDSYEWLGTIPKDGVKLGGVLEKVKFIRDSYYDYDLVKKHFNLSADALKSLLFRTNKKLTDKIGVDTIDLVLSRYDKVSLGMTQFRIRSGKYNLVDILLSDFYSELPEPKMNFYKVEDCETEIKTLYQYSQFGLKDALACCDKSKLAFLLYILQNTTERYKEDQKDLISLLLGINWSIDRYLQKLSQLRGEDFDFEFASDSFVKDNEVGQIENSSEFVESSSDSFGEDSLVNDSQQEVVDDFVPLSDETEFDFSFLNDEVEDEEKEVKESQEPFKAFNAENARPNDPFSFFENAEEDDDDIVLEDL